MASVSLQPPHRMRQALAGGGILFAFAGALGLVLSAAGYRLNWWQVAAALQIAEWSVYTSIIGFVLAVATILWAWRKPSSGMLVIALAAITLSAPVALSTGQWLYAANYYPAINDVSTDTENPPVFWDMPTPTDYPAANRSLQRTAYPDLVSTVLDLPSARAFDLALQVAAKNGWEIVGKDKNEGRIEAVEHSFLFGFPDEIAIRITSAESRSRIDVRSRSRIGRIDRGVNARRIKSFIAAMKAP